MFKRIGQRGRKEKTRLLWGREFRLVEEGLDVEQVVSFVNELMNREQKAPEISAPGETPITSEPESKMQTMEKEAISIVTQDVAGARKESEISEEAMEAQTETNAHQDGGTAAAPGETATPATEQIDQTLYTGEVELAIESSLSLKQVTRLYNRLQTIPELRVLSTVGSAGGIYITVVLDQPVPLISAIVSKVPELSAVPEPPSARSLESKGYLPMLGKRKGVVTRINLTLKAE